MFKEDVLGITLAELTLLLLFLVITAFYFEFIGKTESTDSEQKPTADQYNELVQKLNEKLNRLKSEREALRKSYAEAESIDKYRDELDKLRNELKRLNLEREILQKRLDESELEVNEYSKRLNKIELKSKQTPTCHELGMTPTWLEKIGVIGLNTFSIKGKEYNYNELLQYFSDDLKFAKEHGCNHCVKTWFSDNVSTEDYFASLKNLRIKFIVTPTGKKSK
jgi:Rad3-related DNA helicase